MGGCRRRDVKDTGYKVHYSMNIRIAIVVVYYNSLLLVCIPICTCNVPPHVVVLDDFSEF